MSDGIVSELGFPAEAGTSAGEIQGGENVVVENPLSADGLGPDGDDEGEKKKGIIEEIEAVVHDNTMDIFHALEHNTQNLGCFSKVWEFTFDPYSNFRQGWDVCMLVLVLYSSIYGPYDVAFKEYTEMSLGAWAVDLCFYTDIVFNFWTGFDNGYEVITNKKKIAQNYLRGWFWVDAIATIEWDLIIMSITTKVDRVILRLTRILKVARIARASRLVNRLTQSLTIHSGFVDAAKFFMYVFVVAHLLACFFFMWPLLFDCGIYSAPPNYTPMPDEAGAYPTGWHFEQTTNKSKWQFCPAMYANDKDFLTHNDDMIKEMYLSEQREASCVTLGNQDPDEGCKCTCVPGSWRDQYGLDAKLPVNQYVIALYWSLTTMTTIGYGDYGPKSDIGIRFTMFAEILGLAFFAMLLTQINRVVDVMNEQDNVSNTIKNEITQFMRWNNMDRELVNEVVHFLSFRAGSATGHAMEEDDPRFASLSLNLRRKIKVGLFRPVLERVRFFGWSKVDKKEEKNLQRIFDEMDDDQSGYLDLEEITKLIAHIGLSLSQKELNEALDDMDTKKTNNVDFTEFRQWWYLNKYGTLMPTKCPAKFLDELCWIMESVAVAPHEVVVGDLAPSPLGQRLLYGDELIIILSGSLKVIDTKGTNDEADDEDVQMVHASEGGDLADIMRRRAELEQEAEDEYDESDHEEIRHVDQSENESMIGMQAVLEPHCFALARATTRNWMVKAHVEYSDLLHVDRTTLALLLDHTWPEGRALMRSAALAQYGISEEEALAAPKKATTDPVPDAPIGDKIEFVNNRITKVEDKLDALIIMCTAAARATAE